MFSFASIPPASSIRVTLSTGDVYYGNGFAGFVSDTPITSIAFYSMGGNEPATAIDNFTFGHGAANARTGRIVGRPCLARFPAPRCWPDVRKRKAGQESKGFRRNRAVQCQCRLHRGWGCQRNSCGGLYKCRMP